MSDSDAGRYDYISSGAGKGQKINKKQTNKEKNKKQKRKQNKQTT